MKGSVTENFSSFRSFSTRRSLLPPLSHSSLFVPNSQTDVNAPTRDDDNWIKRRKRCVSDGESPRLASAVLYMTERFPDFERVRVWRRRVCLGGGNGLCVGLPKQTLFANISSAPRLWRGYPETRTSPLSTGWLGLKFFQEDEKRDETVKTLKRGGFFHRAEKAKPA